MKASELIEQLQQAIERWGDRTMLLGLTDPDTQITYCGPVEALAPETNRHETYIVYGTAT